MKYSQQVDSVLIDYAVAIDKIRDSEQSRNFEAAIPALKQIWNDFDVDPDFSNFSLLEQAELYRLSGYFLSNYGKIKNQVNYQERGKDLLSKAIEIYSDFGDFIKVAEAQNALAICYFFEGAILEAEAILEQTAVDFLHDKLHLVYLQNQGNLLKTKIYTKKYDEALKIIDDIKVPMEFCQDKRTSIVYYENSGVVFRRTLQFERAIPYYKKAIELAQEIDSQFFIAQVKNNLAFLYKQKGDFQLAHLYADEAIEIAQNYNQVGWLPHYFDTKSLIYFDEGNFKSALETIDQAISIFTKGEDAGGLTEALWNKCRFLLHLNRKQEAIKLFGELAPLASEKMGEFAVDHFSEEFAELIHVKNGGSLDEETHHFRRTEVITAIRKAKYELKTAAESLKIELPQLTQIIDNEFPELYEEINIERFSLVNKPDEQSKSTRRNISELFLSGAFSNLSGRFSTFYFAAEVMQDVFGISQDAVLAIQPIQKIAADDFILLYDKAKAVYNFGKVQYDDIFDLYFLLENNEPIPFSPDEFEVVGKAAAYLPFAEIDSEKLEFKSLVF